MNRTQEKLIRSAALEFIPKYPYVAGYPVEAALTIQAIAQVVLEHAERIDILTQRSALIPEPEPETKLSWPLDKDGGSDPFKDQVDDAREVYDTTQAIEAEQKRQREIAEKYDGPIEPGMIFEDKHKRRWVVRSVDQRLPSHSTIHYEPLDWDGSGRTQCWLGREPWFRTYFTRVWEEPVKTEQTFCRPRSRARVRDELASIILDGEEQLEPTDSLVDLILDKLIAATDGELADPFLHAVKAGFV